MVDIIYDGSSIWARAYFAAVSHDKDPVTIACRSVLSLMSGRHIGPVNRGLICWDGSKPKTTKKREQEKPADYSEKIAEFSDKIASLSGIEQVYMDAYEADDLVASAAFQSSNQVIVASGDKDLTQVLTDRVGVFDLNKKILLTKEDVCERWGVFQPIQVAVALAVIGDPGDGIKGVPGWGPAKFKRLMVGLGPKNTLFEVIDHCMSQMTEAQQDEFLKCLEVTLLDTDIKGIPEPKQLTVNFDSMPEMFDSTRCIDSGSYEAEIASLLSKATELG